MKKNYLVKIYLSAISLCLLSFSSNAQFFSATTAPQCNTTTGGTEVVNILGATANAAGNATLTVYYTGDLDLSTELIDFYGESSLTTPIGTSTPATAQCFAGYDSVVLTVPMADINNWASDGTVTITAVASSSVSGSVCSGWCIYMKLEYPIVTGPCTSPPTPGNASVSNTTPCPSGDISFNLSGNSFGAGQTYEWQVATSVNGPFTPISGPLSFPSFSTTAPSSAGIYYYTAAVTCSSSPVTTSFSDTISITVPALFPSATYTINGAQPTGGTNFQTFADAVNAMSCGIAGPIIFNVSPGTYSNDSLYLDSLNTSATNTITFNGGGATLNHDGNSVNFATIRLNNTGYVTINNLTVTTTGTGSNYGIEFTGQSSNNTIANCTIVADTTSTSSTNMGIVFDGTANSYSTQGDNSNNTITGCTVIGGYYNIIVYGNTTSNNTGNVFTNNILQNSYTYSLYLYANANATISGNDMSQPTRTNVSTSGTLISSCTGGIIYEKNRIHDLFVGEPASTSAAYCIYFSASDATSINPNTINNNLIYNINNAGGTIYGIYNSSSDYTSIYHNTIVLDDNTVTTSETTRAIFLTGTTAAPVVGADIKNNILVVQRSGTGTNHCIYLDDAPSTTSDNNDYYVGGAATNYVGFLTGPGDQTTLLDWQTNSSQDASSQAVNPVFNNSASGDYTPFSAAIDNIGFPVGITTDILNAARSTSTPDIGAYEFNVPVCSPTGLTAGAASASPSVLCAGGTVTFGLTGQSTGAGITFSWQSSPFATGPFNTVNTDITSSYTATVFAPEYYRCEVVCGSTVVYSDTIFVNAISPLAGTYTIDQNSATSPSNFQSFADAMTALNCGISGPVVFDVVPGSGPYNERIELPSGLVTSVGNTLRINGNGNWLHWSTTTSAQRAAVLIDGHDYVTIDSLNIDVRGGTYGYGVHLINDADNDTISNCVIITDSASTSSNFMGISLSGSATSYSTAGDNNYVVIDGNTIVGGYYGLVSYGSSSEIAMDNIYRNNTITETYYDGIYLYYSSNPTITNNDISKPYRSDVTTSSGIYMGSCSGGGLIARNKIHNLHGGEPTATSDNYGIEFSSTDGTATTPYIIANNLIYDMTGNGDIYGFYNSASDFCKYYFNTVSLDNASSTTTLTTRGIYQTTAVNGFEFRNNIVTITRGGTGTNHGLYFNTAGTITNGAVLDNNVYYVAGTGVNNIGYHTSNSHTTLTAWSASFTPPQETLSVEVDPLYTDIATHNYIPTRLVVNDIGFQVGILTDINNVPRSSTPDPGAYEWTPPPCVTPPVAGNVVVSDTLLCQGENLTLDLVGNSIGTGQTYQWQQVMVRYLIIMYIMWQVQVLIILVTIHQTVTQL